MYTSPNTEVPSENTQRTLHQESLSSCQHLVLLCSALGLWGTSSLFVHIFHWIQGVFCLAERQSQRNLWKQAANLSWENPKYLIESIWFSLQSTQHLIWTVSGPGSSGWSFDHLNPMANSHSFLEIEDSTYEASPRCSSAEQCYGLISTKMPPRAC